MFNNFYAPPASVVEDIVVVIKTKKIYSPTQVACGALGGPVGVIYFLMSNFDALGEKDRKKYTLIAGISLTIAIVAVLVLFPGIIPAPPVIVAQIILARQIAENLQMKKQDIINSPGFDFQSNWRVLFFTVLCSVGSLIMITVICF
jgi:hypothetical protein